jgi:hypothetical protein
LRRAAGERSDAFVIAVMAIGFGAPTGRASATSVSAASTPKVCREAGVTPALVRKIFGASARIGGFGVSETGRCALEAGVHGKPPSNCVNEPSNCTDTDVLLSRLSAYKNDRAQEAYELNSYGHARVRKFSGAGTGAVLMISTKGYGGAASPLVLLKAGHHTVTVLGPYAGEGETMAVYKQWERLARAIHSHLG